MSENLNPRSPTDFWMTGTFRSYVLSMRMLPCGVTIRKELSVFVPT